MARVNTGGGSSALDWLTPKTHEGAPARAITTEQELRRTVMACLLWESGFYESGQSIADRIAALVPTVSPDRVSALAIEARSQMHLRHTPLFLVREMARHASHRPHVRATLAAVIQRADELSEFLAIYWQGGDKRTAKERPLAKSVQRGLADALGKFDAYRLAKYNRDNPITLRDVLFLSHAKPKDEAQASLWKQLVDGTLPTPDTWEVAITAAGKDAEKKRAEWTRLLTERKLGSFALIRNLRNLQGAGVEDKVIRAALSDMKADRILPFRFLSAVRHAPSFAPELESAMLRNLADHQPFDGMTIVLIDISGSMAGPLSAKSEMLRMDAAAGVAVCAREVCESVRVFAFSDSIVEVPAYRGFALADKISTALPNGGTYLGAAVAHVNKLSHDRLIVITDEQSHDSVPGPKGRGFMINVATNQPGVGYGPWVHIDGWSDRVLDFVRAVESDRA